MKFLLVTLIFAATIIDIYGQNNNTCDYDNEFNWRAYKDSFGKNYTGSDDTARKVNFVKADNFIKQFNNGKNNYTFTVGHNPLSDKNDSEWTQILGVKSVPATTRFLGANAGYLEVADRALPTSLDYRNDTCLAAIKNQGQCGSCWAFAAIAPLEFAQCKKNKSSTVVPLSEQQLVDCDTNSTDSGCNGGFYTTAWNYHKKVNGSAKGALYSYSAVQGTCKFNSSSVAAKVSSYTAVQTNNVTAMQTALQNYGPLALAITVINSFQYYKSGVYNDVACNNKSVNHAVVLVGWGLQNGTNTTTTPYWVIRNSWGTGWGLSGYILFQRGTNLCKVETYPYYVTPL